MKNLLFFPITFLTIAILMLAACKDGFWSKERIDPPCPEVSVIAPTSAAFGAKITIRGNLFQADLPSLYEVRIGNETVDSLEVPDDHTMTFRVPKGIGSGLVTVHLKGACDAKVKPAFEYLLTATNVVKFAGTFGQAGSLACPSCLNSPAGIELDGAGNIWIADKSNHVVRQISATGSINTIGDFMKAGCEDYPVIAPSKPHFYSPIDVAVNASGDLYIAESGNFTVRKRDASGAILPYAGKCQESVSVPGNCDVGRIGLPYRIAQNGMVTYIADNGVIRIADGSANPDCPTLSTFAEPGLNYTYAYGIDYNTSLLPEYGPVFITDASERKVKSVTTGGDVKDVITSGESFNIPSAIALDASGNIFVADEGKNQILVIYPGGKTVVLAGTGQEGIIDNVPGLEAKFRAPGGIAVDPKNNKILYVSDTQNHVIRKITLE